MTEYKGDGGNYECPKCGYMFGDICDCENAITLDKKLKRKIIQECNDSDNNEMLKNLIDRVVPLKGYLDFISSDRSPLTQACFFGNYDFVEFLIESGANVNFEDNYDDTPLHRACQNCHLEIVKLLLEHGAEKNVMNAEGNTPEELVSCCENTEQKREIIELLKK